MRVASPRFLRWLILVAVPVLVIAGCNRSGSSAGLNDTAADLQKKLMDAEKKKEDTLEWPPDEAKKKQINAAFGETVADARKRFDELRIPDSDAAKRFYDGFNDYLKTQEEAAKLYTQYFEGAEKKTASKEDEGKLREDFDKMREKRKVAATRLTILQKAYAAEAGFQLKK